MSVSQSIFQKVCPACASNVSLSANQCRCGHRFASDEANPVEEALRDEELYESYLVARVEQTRQSVAEALEMHVADPENIEKKTALELARAVEKEVENDLRAQRGKISALRNIVSGAPAVTPPATRKAPATKPKTATAKTAASPTPRRAAPNTTAVATSSRIAGVLSALKAAKAREEITAKPDTNPAAQFRQEQSARADKVMESIAGEGTINCPNCTATQPVNTARCGCGYTFPAGSPSNLPTLTLCTSDFTALRNTFLKDQNRRR